MGKKKKTLFNNINRFTFYYTNIANIKEQPGYLNNHKGTKLN